MEEADSVPSSRALGLGSWNATSEKFGHAGKALSLPLLRLPPIILACTARTNTSPTYTYTAMSSTTTDSLILTSASETKAIAFNKALKTTFNANIKAPAVDSEEHSARKSVDIVCVIDKSGSMSGEPMALVKETLSFMVGQLKDGDRLSLVTFGDDASLVFSLTSMDETGKTKALDDIRKLSVDGWTHLSGGVMMGLDQIANRDKASENSVSSVLVFTDGQANRGITAVDELVKAVVTKLDGMSSGTKSVSLHTFGFSQNHNPELLTKLAEAAFGVFYYLPSVDKIPEVFADCLGGLLSVVALNVALEVSVEYTGATIAQIHTPFPIRQITAGKHVSISLGQMYSEQSRDILVEVNLPSVDSSDLDAKVLKFKLTSLNRAEQNVESITFATIDRVTEEDPATKEVNEAVVTQKARIVTATAMKEALEHKARGDVGRAKAALSSARGNVTGYGVFTDQLLTAEAELESNSNAGYLWTNMRSHYAQSSSAQSALPMEASNDLFGYSNSVQRKMKAAAPRLASKPVAPSVQPSGGYPPVPQYVAQQQVPQGYPVQQQQQQQMAQAPIMPQAPQNAWDTSNLS
jgi:Mg-chelatase subunit ChlD